MLGHSAAKPFSLKDHGRVIDELISKRRLVTRDYAALPHPLRKAFGFPSFS